jgi:FkbM family methyltransferase
MSPMTLAETWRTARGRGKKAVARLARRVLPRTTLTLAHVEPGLSLTVNLRRHVMFWSGGLARFEPFTVAALRAAVRPGDAVFDVGANIGFFSTLLSRLAGPEGRVFAFEPEPENQAMLRANLDANACGNVTLVACALGARPGTATFSLDEATGATGHLGGEPTAGELAVGTGKVRLIETPVETIDGLSDRLGAVPDVIKMDIEGGEIHALAGAADTLARHRPVVLSELTGKEGAGVVRLLDEHGYTMWDLESGRPVAPGDHPFMIVAIPTERVGGDRARRVLAALKVVAV